MESPVPLIIVEGLFGFAHLVQLGVERVADVGALLGSTLTPQKEALIRQRSTSTYLLLDDDLAGEDGIFGRRTPSGARDEANGALHMLKDCVPVHVPVWPEGKDDPDQLTKRDVWDIICNTPVWSVQPTPPGIDGAHLQ